MTQEARTTRAVILAAGRGARLGNILPGQPKVMLPIAGQTLLGHQRRALRNAGISDVHIVVGHGANEVRVHPDAGGLTFWNNLDYATTNMVSSLLCASDLLDGTTDLVVSYGDIVYEPRLLAALFSVDAPVAVVVDLEWRDYWEARMDDPLTDAETLLVDGNGRLLQLGGRPTSYANIQGQFIGLILVRADMAKTFATEAAHQVSVDPNIYMTTLLQRLIEAGHHVHAASVENGWLEFDQPGDLAVGFARFWRAQTW